LLLQDDDDAGTPSPSPAIAAGLDADNGDNDDNDHGDNNDNSDHPDPAAKQSVLTNAAPAVEAADNTHADNTCADNTCAGTPPATHVETAGSTPQTPSPQLNEVEDGLVEVTVGTKHDADKHDNDADKHDNDADEHARAGTAEANDYAGHAVARALTEAVRSDTSGSDDNHDRSDSPVDNRRDMHAATLTVSVADNADNADKVGEAAPPLDKDGANGGNADNADEDADLDLAEFDDVVLPNTLPADSGDTADNGDEDWGDWA
jgi:hypothetical protein